MMAHYHQTKISIGFWYKQGLNLKSLIQLSETYQLNELKSTILYFFWFHMKTIERLFEIKIKKLIIK